MNARSDCSDTSPTDDGRIAVEQTFAAYQYEGVVHAWQSFEFVLASQFNLCAAFRLTQSLTENICSLC
jgi:hypothetical protein